MKQSLTNVLLALGLFHPFLDDKEVEIFGIEAAGAFNGSIHTQFIIYTTYFYFKIIAHLLKYKCGKNHLFRRSFIFFPILKYGIFFAGTATIDPFASA